MCYLIIISFTSLCLWLEDLEQLMTFEWFWNQFSSAKSGLENVIADDKSDSAAVKWQTFFVSCGEKHVPVNLLKLFPMCCLSRQVMHFVKESSHSWIPSGGRKEIERLLNLWAQSSKFQWIFLNRVLSSMTLFSKIRKYLMRLPVARNTVT